MAGIGVETGAGRAGTGGVAGAAKAAAFWRRAVSASFSFWRRRWTISRARICCSWRKAMASRRRAAIPSLTDA
ncbi:hypothetical protein CHT98_22660 (plasmid) [Azospirillum brasilense]|uniref:Uncharacterized protein n=1 Tax=Azospirillum brasilense TaxID=192 RepID=A0A235H9Z5_AZOBR|nr:hypothetical protein CHT98_22660 [Azospirillum brasilense]